MAFSSVSNAKKAGYPKVQHTLKYLLELPEEISGYYLDHNCNEIAITDLRTDEDRFGIANTLEQARVG
jgi:hypothetical protein